MSGLGKKRPVRPDEEDGVPLGSFMDDGVRRSARLNPAEAVDTATGSDEAFINALTGMSGGRRRRMRGGGERWDAVKAFAVKAARATGRYTAKTVGAPIATELVGVFNVTAQSADRILVAFMSVVTLLGGVIQFTVGTTGRVAANASSAARQAAAFLKRPENQQTSADLITAPANIATSIAVAIAALTQGGLVSLTTVVAIVLRTLGMALTGPGRATATVGFYVWFLGQDAATQQKIKDDAAAYAAAVKAGTKEVPAAAASLASAIAGGVAAARAAVVADPAAAAVAPAPADAQAAIVAAAQEVAAAGRFDGAVGDAAVLLAGAVVVAQPPGNPVAAVIEGADAAVAPGAGDGSAAMDAAAAPAVPAAGDGSAARGAMDAAAAPAAGDGAAAPVVKRARKTPAPAPAGGRRKTKKSKAKRRVTRRRKVTKVLGAPVFVY
jgi:hypothetical protein